MDLGTLPAGWASWEIEAIMPGSRRTMDERLVRRGAWVRKMVSDRVFELPAGAPVRRRALTTGVRGSFGLINRLDFDAALRAYGDSCHLFYEDGAALGIDREGTGREGIKRFLNQFDDAFGKRVFRPTTIVDPGGPTVAGKVEAVAKGHASGVEIGLVIWNAWTFRGGAITDQYMAADRDKVFSRLLG
jgi:hypothetical protein